MNMKKTLLLLLAISACYPEVPYNPDIEIESQEEAMDILEEAVELHYGVELGNYRDCVSVKWTDTICDDTGKYSTLIDNEECADGVIVGEFDIYVAIANNTALNGKTCTTALMAEYGHHLYWELTGHLNYHSDSGDDTEFMGVIQEAHTESCRS